MNLYVIRHGKTDWNLESRIQGKTNISLNEMEALINDIRKCDNPYTCPHGRSSVIFYSNYELEKLFKRAM